MDAAIDFALGAAGVTAAAPGGVHRDVAPTSVTTYPYITFQMVDGPPERRVFGAGRRIVRYRYLVKAVGKGLSAKAAKDALAAADGVLDDATLTVSGATFLSCRRERPMGDFRENVAGGVTYQHVGAFYAIEVQWP